MTAGLKESPFPIKGEIMKALAFSLLVSGALLTPVAAFAQSAASAETRSSTHGGLTRAEVRADLVRVERAGYLPVANDNRYPDDIQHAEAISAASQQQSMRSNAPASR